MTRPTLVECVDEAASVLAQALIARDSLTVEDAARAAWTPTGPSVAELEDEIRRARGARHLKASA